MSIAGEDGAAGTHRDVEVAIVGAGPAGLAAAIALRRLGVAEVLVLEREAAAGGIPRHSHHTGYGVRDLHRFTTGPRYAALYAARARAAGVHLATNTMATGWDTDGALRVTSPSGVGTVRASAVLLATGARERPRPARLVPGDRGAGVYTTGELQQAVYQHRHHIGHHALIIGAEHVSYSAALTLRHAGVEIVAMITDKPRHETFAAFALAAKLGLRLTPQTHTVVLEVRGRPRLREALIENLHTGRRTTLQCDTVVFTGDWIPDNELARSAGLTIDAGTLGPAVDASAHTSNPRIFAAGNLCHPVETADIAALQGHAAAANIARWLGAKAHGVQHTAISMTIDDTLQWVHPQRLADTSTRPAGGSFTIRSRVHRRRPTITVLQGDQVLWRGRRRQLVPGRPTRIPSHWLARVNEAGPPIKITVDEPGQDRPHFRGESPRSRAASA